MKRIRGFATLIAAVAALGGLPARAADTTSVSIVDVVFDGRGVMVTGDAAFGTELPMLVGRDPTGDAAIDPSTSPLGLDVTDITIGADPVDVTFTIGLAELEVPPPNEVVRYFWQFLANGKVYWIQAKSSDVSGIATAGDPVGTVNHVQGAFRLRGDCGPLAALTNCVHIAWLDGVFDVDADEVRVKVPVGLRPDFAPGSAIEPETGVSAAVQPVVSSAATSDVATQDETYIIPERVVRVGIAPAGAPAEYSVDATVEGDGRWRATLDASTLAGDYTVHAIACYGASGCATTQAPISI